MGHVAHWMGCSPNEQPLVRVVKVGECGGRFGVKVWETVMVMSESVLGEENVVRSILVALC